MSISILNLESLRLTTQLDRYALGVSTKLPRCRQDDSENIVDYLLCALH